MLQQTFLVLSSKLILTETNKKGAVMFPKYVLHGILKDTNHNVQEPFIIIH